MIGIDDYKFIEMPPLAIGIILILFTIGGTIGYLIGEVTYDYEINKCKYLKTSPYDFDFKIEKDANYAQSCYFYNNHPLAKFLVIGGITLFGLFFGFIPTIFIWGHYDMKEFDRKLNERYK